MGDWVERPVRGAVNEFSCASWSLGAWEVVMKKEPSRVNRDDVPLIAASNITSLDSEKRMQCTTEVISSTRGENKSYARCGQCLIIQTASYCVLCIVLPVVVATVLREGVLRGSHRRIIRIYQLNGLVLGFRVLMVGCSLGGGGQQGLWIRVPVVAGIRLT